MKKLKWSLISCFLVSLYLAAYLDLQASTPTPIVHDVQSPPNLRTLIQEIPPKYGVSPLLIAAIVEAESNGQLDAVRFEPNQMSRAAKYTKNPEQQRMLATSFGAGQVMGWHAAMRDMSWTELLKPEVNMEVSCSILKAGLDRHKHLPRSQQIKKALLEYNGSNAYAERVYRRLGDLLIEKTL